MTEIDEVRAELARVLAILRKIRDIADCPDPRFPNGQWYKAIVDHVRRYLNEIFDNEEDHD
jgi:hypothetical protein